MKEKSRTGAGAPCAVALRFLRLAAVAVLLAIGLAIGPTWAQDDAPPEEGVTTEEIEVKGAKPKRPAGQPAVPGRVMVAPEPVPLEDVLLEKGIITMDDWVRIKAEEEQKVLRDAGEFQIAGSPRWFDRLRILGYTQMRYAMPSSPALNIPLSDSVSTSRPRAFYLRRIRMVFQGDMSERMSLYLQPAFEGTQFATSNAELVDAFADFHITKNRQHRLRFGIHRVPNAFDTYRSSSQRQELDRFDAQQSGAPGERDLGIAYFWTSKIAQQRFAQLATYHNGPGDYGNIQIMVYNGQGRNKPELNSNKHVGIGLQHPFELPNGRLVQLGVMGYRGLFIVTGTGAVGSTARSWCQNALIGSDGCQFTDERVNFYIWSPPQPWGIMAEYTVGRGPFRNANGILSEGHLEGGYVQVNYTWRYSEQQMLTPYVRYGQFNGGIKSIAGANGRARMWNIGLVWEPDSHWRFVVEYLNRNSVDEVTFRAGLPQAAYNADMVRLQAQWFWN